MEKGKDLIVMALIAVSVYAASHIVGIGCPIKFLTGISCGGCGMTRAWIALLSLDIKKAFYYHPLVLVPPFYCAAFALRNKIGISRFKAITAVCLVLFLAVYLIRLLDPLDEVVTFDIKKGFIMRLFGIGGIFHG